MLPKHNACSEQPYMAAYARVSTTELNPGRQLDALKEAGCRRVFTDGNSGASITRPQLRKALASLKAGNLLVVGG